MIKKYLESALVCKWDETKPVALPNKISRLSPHRKRRELVSLVPCFICLNAFWMSRIWNQEKGKRTKTNKSESVIFGSLQVQNQTGLNPRWCQALCKEARKAYLALARWVSVLIFRIFVWARRRFWESSGRKQSPVLALRLLANPKRPVASPQGLRSERTLTCARISRCYWNFSLAGENACKKNRTVSSTFCFKTEQIVWRRQKKNTKKCTSLSFLSRIRLSDKKNG